MSSDLASSPTGTDFRGFDRKAISRARARKTEQYRSDTWAIIQTADRTPFQTNNAVSFLETGNGERIKNARSNVIANQPINRRDKKRDRARPRVFPRRSLDSRIDASVSRVLLLRLGLANLPIGILIGTNSDRELDDSVEFLRRGEKSLNRRSYRIAPPLIDETRTVARDASSGAGFALQPAIRIRFPRFAVGKGHDRFTPRSYPYQISPIERREAHPRRISLTRKSHSRLFSIFFFLHKSFYSYKTATLL